MYGRIRELREDKKVVFEVMAPSVLESENEVELTQPIEENNIVPLVNETKEEDKYKAAVLSFPLHLCREELMYG